MLAGVGLAIGAYATYLSRDITDALIGKHLAEFYRVMLLAAGAAAVGMLAKVFQNTSAASSALSGANGLTD